MGFRQISCYLPEQVPANKFLFAGIVPANKFLFAGTVPANKFLFAGAVPANNLFQSLNQIFHTILTLFHAITTSFVLIKKVVVDIVVKSSPNLLQFNLCFCSA